MRLLPFRSLLSAVCCAGLVSCSDSKPEDLPENVITHNDFESMVGWAPANPSLTTVKAHSGRYSLKVDNGVEYGLGYAVPLVQASPTRLQKMTVSAWVLLVAKDAKANLVVEIKNPADDSQKIFWEALELGQEVKQINEWKKVEKTFTLPTTIEPTYELRVYLWRGEASEPVFLDDMVISRAQ
ncbi:carbohydrate binding domain-containing protein [Hymenobacter sp. NST-14]|uniref:carbohydrate binding domain-containing protein n=1 Tax=Hymenobacter piscis TaxID=2839984 RepID=UPI001C032ADC|nr:carbohydrate binding domain-containing protein [Hymenobacter piscis]MBT9392997.1 carbohydrate binding domain-containing protein [Hymenobacter piscis]